MPPQHVIKSTMRARSWVMIAWGFVVVCSMGASCTPQAGMPFGLSGPSAPIVLSATSSMQQVIAAVNQNSSRIQTYQASKASISMPAMPGLPLLSGSIAAERPGRFRLRAETRLSGPEVDLGSNDDRFWFWARRNEPPAVFTSRHAEFATSPMRAQLPVDPSWLIDALGMVTLDSTTNYQGPFPRTDGSIEIRSQSPIANGMGTRVYVIDAATAWVREQHLYDAAGTLMASVTADKFRFDPVSQVSLPERATVRVPAADMALVINTGPILVNAPISGGTMLWQMPQINGSPVVDLANQQATPVAAATNAWDLAGNKANAPWQQNSQPINAAFASQSAGVAPVGVSPQTTIQSNVVQPNSLAQQGSMPANRMMFNKSQPSQIPASGVVLDSPR